MPTYFPHRRVPMTEEEKKTEETPEDSKVEEKKADTKPKSTAKKEIVGDGDVITVEYDAWIINADGSEDLFETTSEEKAKEHEIFDEKAKYTPLITVVGAARVAQGLDDSFKGAAIGEKKVVEIPPEDGAGDWDATQVKIYSIKEFVQQKIDPMPGMRVTFKNKPGTIITVTSGRVRIDFNPPLAGKTVRYEYMITEKTKTTDERALKIIAMDYGEAEGFQVTGKGEDLEIVLPEICKYDQGWFVMKYRVVGDLREHTDFTSIKFVEEYLKKEEPEEAPPEEEKPEPKEDKAKKEPEAKEEEPVEEETPEEVIPVEELAEEEIPEEEREKQPEEL